MAANVFGNPVTDEIAEQYYEVPITQLMRAKVAYKYINAEGRDTNAMQFAENLKAQYGDGISVLGLFYNATGGSVTYVTTQDYHGNVWKAPYPTVIQNGQWAAFLHVRGSIFVGASAAVVYRGMNDQGNEYDYLCAWAIPFSGDNHAYTEIRNRGHYAENIWGIVENLLIDSRLASKDEWNGCVSYVSIGNGTTSQYQAILTLKDVLPSTGVYALPPTTAGIDDAPKPPPTTTAGIADDQPTAAAAAAAETDEEA